MRLVSGAVRGLLVGVLAVVSLSGCHGGNSTKADVCQKIKDEVARVQGDLNQPASSTQLAQSLTNSAATVRGEGKRVGGDVEAAAEGVAKNLDAVAGYFQDRAAGRYSQPDLSGLNTSADRFRDACKTGLHG